MGWGWELRRHLKWVMWRQVFIPQMSNLGGRVGLYSDGDPALCCSPRVVPGLWDLALCSRGFEKRGWWDALEEVGGGCGDALLPSNLVGCLSLSGWKAFDTHWHTTPPPPCDLGALPSSTERPFLVSHQHWVWQSFWVYQPSKKASHGFCGGDGNTCVFIFLLFFLKKKNKKKQPFSFQ